MPAESYHVGWDCQRDYITWAGIAGGIISRGLGLPAGSYHVGWDRGRDFVELVLNQY
ncbi:hypothetical protein [Paenibacillus sp. GCM10012306]|uniref:hypothetical protein n=1 Tax=Paenibacillus sp. GCM10012306 TaxID=3317342 RepID=UPI003609A88A